MDHYIAEMEWQLHFSGLGSWWWTGSVVLAVVIALALFWVLRKYEAKLVSKPVGFVLLLLRICVLGLLLLTLLKPVFVKSWDLDRQPRLLIGFDVSESMDTADQHAGEGEMLKWAKALGMLGNDATDELIDTWINDYAEGREPNWAGDSGNADAAFANVRRRQVQDIFAELRTMPRTEFVRRLLLARPNDLLVNFRKQTAVDLQVFGMEQLKVSDDGLNSFLQSDREDVRPIATDLAGMLSTAISDENGSAIQGLVLLTDGRQTSGTDPTIEADRLRALEIPVFTVPIGSVEQPRDVSVANIDAPKTVFVEDTAVVRGTVRADGYRGQELTVYLKDGDRVVDQKTTAVVGPEFEVEFELPSEAVGSREYTLSTDLQPGELREDNNSRPFTVSVVDNKSRVMLVEGDARWEFRYLKNALERDKRVRLKTILFRQPFLQLLNRPFLDSQWPAFEEFQQQLSDTDILIMGDISPQKMSERIWQAIEKAVSDDGLTLLVIPGRRHLPSQYESATLDRLLPVTEPSRQVAERYQRSLPESEISAFRLQPTASVSRMAVFDFSDPVSGQADVLQKLPGHLSAYSGTPKPVATVWANLQVPGPDLSQPLAAVVHHYYGFGQVVWMGIDSTWRWRLRAGDTWHHRFWGQIVRWAARSKASAGNDQVRLTLSTSVMSEAESAEVAVRWEPSLVGQLSDSVVSLNVERIDKDDLQNDDERRIGKPSESADRTMQLVPLPDAESRYSGRLSGLKPGTYRVQLQLQNSGIELQQPVFTELVVKAEVSTELADVRCQRDFLQQLADTTG
ncbi:MAG: hypothetical protein ABJZ55_05415, partial [Fuerstiella sp.]